MQKKIASLKLCSSGKLMLLFRLWGPIYNFLREQYFCNFIWHRAYGFYHGVSLVDM